LGRHGRVSFIFKLAPAIYSMIESVFQLRGEANQRQIFPKPKNSLVYAYLKLFKI
jgi:hypothetical protein